MFSRNVLQTGLNPPDAERRLASLVRPPLSLHQRLDNRQTAAERAIPFVGWVGDGRFKFHRAIPGVRGLEAMVTGHIVAGAAGAELQLLVRPPIAMAIFDVAWLLLLVAMLTTQAVGAGVFVVFALAMPIVSVWLFRKEKERTLQALRDAFPETLSCQDATS